MEPKVSTRIARLESARRRDHRLAAAVLGVAAVLLLSGLARPSTVPDVIQAKGFRVVDDSGRTRAHTYTSGDQVVFRMLDSSGKLSAQIMVSDQGQAIFSTHREDQPGFFSAGVQKDGGTILRLDGVEKEDRALIVVPPPSRGDRRGPHIQTWDDGKLTLEAP